MKTEGNIISEWLDKNGDPKIEIKVLNEVIDKLLQQQSEMFSGEEVLDILKTFLYNSQMGKDVEDVELWFEQFKKK